MICFLFFYTYHRKQNMDVIKTRQENKSKGKFSKKNQHIYNQKSVRQYENLLENKINKLKTKKQNP